jgi:hypothetical protein
MGYGVITAKDIVLTGGTTITSTASSDFPGTVGNGKSLYQLIPSTTDPWVDWVTTGSATATDLSSGYRGVRMTVTDSGDKIVLQTREYVVCPANRGNITIVSAIVDSGTLSGQSGVVFRMGCFSDEAEKTNSSEYMPGGQGYFLEYDSGTFYLVERTSDGSTSTDTRVTQTSWSVDSLSGSLVETCRITVAIARDVLCKSCKVAVAYGEDLTYVHDFDTSAVESPVAHDLPIRFELSCSEALTADASADILASSVGTSIGEAIFGKEYTSGICPSVTLGTSWTPVMSLRVSEIYCRDSVFLRSMELCNIEADVAAYQLVLNGTLTNESFQTSSDYNTLLDTSATAISGGTVLMSGFIENGAREKEIGMKISSDITGDSDTITLCCKTLGTSTVTISASFLFSERN